MRSVRDFTGIYIHREAVDMRKSINGLAVIVANVQMGDLFGRHLFVFIGRGRDKIKILYFDRSGFCLWQKRLEKEKFFWPKKDQGSDVIKLTADQLEWLLDGYDVWKMKPHRELKFEIIC